MKKSDGAQALAKFDPREKRALIDLAAIVATRMLGLSALLPVLSLYALDLDRSTPFLAGLAFSAYGLTQALGQAPFGYLSDLFGRRPVIVAGMSLFVVGSFTAAFADNIYFLIGARLLQGAGAVASAIFAALADIVAPTRLARAMAALGASIGLSVMAGMALGPIGASLFGARSLFFFVGFFALVGLGIALFRLDESAPTPPSRSAPGSFRKEIARLIEIATAGNLIGFNLAASILNIAMVSVFFLAPIILSRRFEFDDLALIYPPMALAGLIAMGYSARLADRASAAKLVCSMALIGLAVSMALIGSMSAFGAIIGALALFFISFCALEANLPAALSKVAPPARRGATIGFFNFASFAGTFCGGALAGLVGVDHPRLYFAALATAILAALLVLVLTAEFR